MSANQQQLNKLAIGSDESSSAANRASRINSLVSRMFARAGAGPGGEGLASQVKATSTQTLLLGKDDKMVQTTLVNAAIRSSSMNVAQKPAKTGKAKKSAKPDASQPTLLKKEQPAPAAAASAEVPRRNLFGIRLNHDQLKQDLQDMWRDQIEQQKKRWNFDFETLRPTTSAAAAANAAHKTSGGDQSERFKWTRVTYYTPGLPAASSSMVPSGFDRAELFNNSQGDYEDHEYGDDASETEQEEDDALAMPQFYKYQRRLKFNDEPARQSKSSIKMMTVARKPPADVKSESSAKAESKNPMTFEPIFKMALKNSQPVVDKKPEASAKKSTAAAGIRRPKAVKRAQPSLALAPSAQNLIITFSENRKDTLRSASNHATTTTCTAALTVTSTKVKLTAREGETAFTPAPAPAATTKAAAETLKQQSLLDIFKQRKRRNTTVSGKPEDAKTAGGESRSHSVAPSRENVPSPSKAGRQSRITTSATGTVGHNLRSHSSNSSSKGYCKIFLRNGTAAAAAN